MDDLWPNKGTDIFLRHPVSTSVVAGGGCEWMYEWRRIVTTVGTILLPPIPALLCSTHVISVPRPLQSAVREPSIKLMRSFITEFQMFHCFVKGGVKGDKIPLWVVKFGHKLLINLVSTKINWDINRYNLHICFDPSRANDVLLSNAEVEEKTWWNKVT